LILLLLACADGPEVQDSEVLPELLIPLRDELLLRRLSLDLRGVPPTLEELDALEADPAQLEVLRDAYLDDPLLEDRLVAMFADRWHTRVDEFQVPHSDHGFSNDREFAYERDIGEEPLRLMAWIATTDQHWPEIVTSDKARATALLAEIWPLDYPEGASGWQTSTWTDQRPPVGVLASNGLWWRYTTNNSNMNRARAATLVRLLLCQDMLSRPVTLEGSVSLEDEDGTAQAIKNAPSCVACHSSIEPLASSLFGFWTVIEYNALESSTYHPERESLGEEYLEAAPGYFGQPLAGLTDLGVAIANDPRFYRCTAENAAAMLWRREVESEDFVRIEELRQSFIEDELLYRDLLRAVTDTPEYRAGALADHATEEDLDREPTLRLLSPDQVALTLKTLTGFTWTTQGYEQLANDELGHRILLGGVDGYQVTRPQRDPGLTWTLVVERASQAAADHVVDTELVAGASPTLFRHVDLSHQPGDEAFTAELEELHRRLYATRADETWLGMVEGLWLEVEAEEGPAEAWKAVVSVLFRDPAFMGY
jgi:hypothetical protein